MSAEFVDPDHPENHGVLAYLRASGRPGQPLLQNPSDVVDPYYRLGSHPDIVERVWDELGAPLPHEARCVVLGRPALADSASGVVLALALGMAYALRVPPDDREEALAAGLKPTHTYNPPTAGLDAATIFGRDWLFGTFAAREPDWVATAAALSRIGLS